MARLAELRKTAKEMGISKAVILRATTASALEKVIADHGSHDKPKAKAKAKAKGSKPQRKNTARKPQARKNSGRKASTPAKSKGAKAKRSSNSNGSRYEAKGGRNTLDSVDYGITEGWNPRSGSAPDRIIKSLKKFRGNRTKVFEALKGDVWEFVAKKKQNGEKRSKPEALEMLKWRISRTAWDFALRTGQHEASANRVEYGTGGTGDGVFKRKKSGSAQSRSKASSSKPKAKPGRKPAAAKKRSQAARKGATTKAKKRARAGSSR